MGRGTIQQAAAALLLLGLGVGVAWRAIGQSEAVSDPNIEAWDETLDQARAHGVDYRRILTAAERGDQAAIIRLLEFSDRVDAAGACGHATALFQLMERLGDEVFSSAIDETPPLSGVGLPRMLEAGVDYGSAGKWKSIEEIRDYLIRNFPLSYEAGKRHEVTCRS